MADTLRANTFVRYVGAGDRYENVMPSDIGFVHEVGSAEKCYVEFREARTGVTMFLDIMPTDVLIPLAEGGGQIA